jgi:hypothetical protein
VTTIGKALAIFIAAASVVFLCLSLMAWQIPIPDWQSKIKVLSEYQITPQEGEKTTWSAQVRYSKQNVTSSPVLPKVLLECFNKSIKEYKDQIAALKASTEDATQKIEAQKQFVALDITGIELRTKAILAQIEAINKQKETLTAQAAVETNKAQKIQEEAELLRNDSIRLMQEITELQTERYRISDLKAHLKDLIIRTEGLNLRLRERNAQLSGG